MITCSLPIVKVLNRPTLVLFFILSCFLLPTVKGQVIPTPATTINYTPSSAIIANPERGLQKYSITPSDYSTRQRASSLTLSQLRNWKNSSDKVTVVFRYFLLDAFINQDINAVYLANMQKDFDNIRSAGMKLIIRFSYSDEYTAEDERLKTPQQATKAQILRHINQLTPLLQDNKDVILSHQAGFIGTWGEWYYTHSSEFGHEDLISRDHWSNRKDILDAMLTATPAEIPLQVRYVGIKTRVYGPVPLIPQTAYQNTPHARIGFFNDAFLNNWGDQGTYSVNSECQNPVGTAEYNYLSNETQFLPMTGETNGLNPCNSGSRTKGSNAVNELNLTHWTTLNRDYHPDFWDGIRSSGHYDDILKNLGYRFVLKNSTVTEDGLNFDFNLELENVGYAQIFKKREAYLIFKNTADNSISSYKLNTDVRSWKNNISISETISPNLEGTFELFLWLPDEHSSLSTNSDYSIQCANINLWDAVTGYNSLQQTVQLKCSPSQGTDVQIACNEFTWIDGNTYTSDNNTATYILTNKEGCDSIVTLDLTINSVSDKNLSIIGSIIYSTNIDASYQWLDCQDDFRAINGATNISYTPTKSGDYAVALTENGCTDTTECINIILVDTEQSNVEPNFTIFPNPANEMVFIDNPENQKGTIDILDLSGKVIQSVDLNNNLMPLDIQNLQSGLLTIRIRTDNGIAIRHIVKF